MKEKKQGQSGSDVKDQFHTARGRLDIEVRSVKGGHVVERRRVENLVVNNGKTIMAYLLAEADSGYQITQFVVGTGTTAASEGDVSLEVPITPVKAIASYDYPDATSVRFTATLESDEANGFPISEAGLFSTSHGMLARVVFAVLNKSESFRFVYRWSIYW